MNLITRRPGYFITGLLLVVLFFFSTCKKEPQELGLDLVENNPLEVAFSDTTSVVAYSQREDSIRTDETSVALLGNMFDPVFGKTTAIVFTQISLSSASPDFGTNPQCDSLVFSLQYTGYYGDTTTPQTFRFYEITEQMYLDSSYYSNELLAYDPVALENHTFAPRPTDSVLVDTTKFEPHLRFVMNPALGNLILTAPESALDSNVSFREYFKGLAIVPDDVASGPGRGALLYFNFYANISRINLYYHNDEEDSLVYRLSLNSTSNARFVHFDHHGYEDASDIFRQQTIMGDTTLGQNQVYIQPMAGVKVKIEFPTLLNWVKENNIAVNEAQLIFYNQEPEGYYPAPVRLALYKLNDDGTLGFLIDQSEGDTYFDGLYSGNRYRFRINRYMQQVFNGDESNNGLYLFPSGASISASRVVLNGSQSVADKITLQLIYTKPNP